MVEITLCRAELLGWEIPPREGTSEAEGRPAIGEGSECDALDFGSFEEEIVMTLNAERTTNRVTAAAMRPAGFLRPCRRVPCGRGSFGRLPRSLMAGRVR